MLYVSAVWVYRGPYDYLFYNLLWHYFPSLVSLSLRPYKIEQLPPKIPIKYCHNLNLHLRMFCMMFHILVIYENVFILWYVKVVAICSNFLNSSYFELLLIHTIGPLRMLKSKVIIQVLRLCFEWWFLGHLCGVVV